MISKTPKLRMINEWTQVALAFTSFRGKKEISANSNLSNDRLTTLFEGVSLSLPRDGIQKKKFFTSLLPAAKRHGHAVFWPTPRGWQFVKPGYTCLTNLSQIWTDNASPISSVMCVQQMRQKITTSLYSVQTKSIDHFDLSVHGRMVMVVSLLLLLPFSSTYLCSINYVKS